jgi:excisionase family DNA binding protein
MTHRENEEILDISEAAERMGVSVDTIRRRLRAGELPRAARGTGSNAPWRIPLGDLIAAGLTPVGGDAGSSQQPTPTSSSDLGGHVAVLHEVVAILQRQIRLLENTDRGGPHA